MGAGVGLGIMGRPMALNLIKAGHSLTVYDIVAAPVEQLVTAGAAAAESAREAAMRSELTITMLPDGPDVEAAVLGEHLGLPGIRTGRQRRELCE